MAETIKSALLVDYESLHRSLAGTESPGETRLAERAAAWVAAFETGRLIGPRGTRRRLVMKRCYAGSSIPGKQRNALATAGFEIVDVAGSGSGRGSADIHLAIDTIDALAEPQGADEFILLTASSALAPLLARLKAGKRATAIYSDAATPAADKALADAILDRTLFAEFLASDEMPGSEDKSAGSVPDRAEIEAFARRIHAATNIPLFSPKTYSELFTHLTDEIRENGYHFQATARNVADRMTASGRNVTRRQVVFIVKGLALKGHVFSTGDTPDTLAEVFREQARYLITNAGLSLDDHQERLLKAWFVSRPSAAPTSPVAAKPQAAPAGETGGKPAAAAPERPQAETVQRPPPPPPTVEEKPPAAALAPEKPFATPKSAPVFVKPAEPPKPAAKPAPKTAPPPAAQIKAPPSPSAREEAKAVIAARIAASAKLKPSARPGSKAAKTAPAASPPAKPPPRKPATEPAADELESSILAAIAEAVDVLVDDSTRQEPEPEPEAPPPREPPPKRKPTAAAKTPEPQPAPEEEPPADDDADIGDQIQRIIASYNRNRGDE